ncbi:thioesterase domain-containing protein, partial [Thalassotalea sp. 1_MG-2023]|uniref:thioesterase domain-containing protein n=1 Tax=Thalassotalea sp. 1_MG-2023 TaxID=3062680 RepID=UPI0026E117A0
WSSLLGVEQISRNANFFSLGGHSLLAIRLRVAINKTWLKDVSIHQIFAAPVLEKQALLLASPNTFEQRICHLLKKGDTNQPVFIVHPVGGDTLCYQSLAQEWSSSSALYGICHPDIVSKGKTHTHSDLSELAKLYVGELKQVQPEGPYQIMGWSLGGVICLEIAKHLIKAGDKVAYLGMLDSQWHTHEQLTSQAFSTLESTSESDWLAFDSEYQISELCLATGLNIEQQRALVLSGIEGLERFRATSGLHIEKVQYFSANNAAETQSPKEPCIDYLKQISECCDVIDINATHYSIVERSKASIIDDWVRQSINKTKGRQCGKQQIIALTKRKI